MSFAIVTDSSANLPQNIILESQITVISLPYFIDGKECEAVSPDEFNDEEYYGKIKQGVSVSTALINPQKYIEYFSPILEKGEDILFVGLSSGVSGSFAAAIMAKEELSDTFPERKICLVDSLGASLGEGLLVIKAAKCKARGMDLEETAQRLEKLRKNIYQVFIVDDLNHLRRTGRLSNISSLVGLVLGIRPLLKGSDEGKIVAFEKHRGKKAAIKAMADKYNTLAKDTRLVGISHCGCKSDAEYLISLLNQKNPPKEILTVKHEPATGSHLGPGAIALFFEGDSNVREF